MKRLIIDFLWRAKWRWMPPAFFYFVLAMLGSIERDAAFVLLPLVSALLSLTLLTAIFDNDSLPNIVSLPLSRKQLGRVFWFGAIMAPSMLMASILNPLALLAGQALQQRPGTLPAAAPMSIVESALLSFAATAYALAIAMLSNRLNALLLRRGVRPLFVHLATRFLPIFFFPFVTMAILALSKRASLEDVTATLFIAAGVSIAVWLYARAELLVDWRLSRDQAQPSPHSSIKRRKTMHASRWKPIVAGMMPTFIAFMVSVVVIIGISNGIRFSIILISLSAMTCVLVLPWIGSLRSMRALPWSATTLAAVLLGIVMASSALCWIVVAIVQTTRFQSPTDIPWWYAISAILWQSISVPMFLRFGRSGPVVFLAPALMTSAPVVSGIALESIGPLLLAVSCAAAGVGYIWTLHELRQPLRSYPAAWTKTSLTD